MRRGGWITNVLTGLDINVLLGLSWFSFLVAAVGASLISEQLLPPRDKLKKTKRAEKVQEGKLSYYPTLNGQAIDEMLKKNIFNSEGKLAEEEEIVVEEEVQEELPDGDIPKSKLAYEVVGIIFAGDSKWGLATLKHKSKRKIASYLAGDFIENEVKVDDIYATRVVLSNKGRREYLELVHPLLERTKRRKIQNDISPSEQKIAPLAVGPVADTFKEEGFERVGNEVNVTRSYVNNLLGPLMSKVLQDAKAEPNMVGGELNGFKLSRIREDSIYQKVGFQSGDIVQEINGVPLRDAAGAIRLLQSLRNEEELEVRVSRGGSSFNLDIRVQ